MPDEAIVLVPIHLLQPGESAFIHVIEAEESLARRLAEKGIRVGCRVEMLQPGHPALLRVGDTKLSLRVGQGMEVLVDTEMAPDENSSDFSQGSISP